MTINEEFTKAEKKVRDAMRQKMMAQDAREAREAREQMIAEHREWVARRFGTVEEKSHA